MSQDKLSYFKSQFSHSNERVHLNNAGLSPISKPARDKINYWAERFFQEGFWTDADYMTDVSKARTQLAHLIGCRSDEIAWFQSAAGGINQFAFGIGLQPDDEVLMWDQEYSSHLYPWKSACDRSGAKLKLLESENNLETPTEKYLSAINPKTRVAAFSWVQFSSGARMDVERVVRECKQRGIVVFIDTAQGLGLHPCELWRWGADAIAGGSHKWLVSPVGVGYLAIRKELALRMKPHVIGAYTYGTCDDPSNFACEPKTDATKFEPGSKQVLEITALGASCELLNTVGVQTIEKESCQLGTKIHEGLTLMGFKVLNPYSFGLSPIVTFTPPDHVPFVSVGSKLAEEKINFALRGGGYRVSPNAFNSDAEIQKFLNILSKI